MYPLCVQLASPQIGFAVANDAQEHAALTGWGYGPALEAANDPVAVAVVEPVADAAPTLRDELLAQAEAVGLKVDGRWSDARLAEELAKLQ